MSENTNETNVKDPLEGTYFHDADIIPMVQYQVYGLDKVWFWDNEGQNYTRTNASTIKIQLVEDINREYKAVGALTLVNSDAEAAGTSAIDFEGDSWPEENAAPEGAKVGQFYKKDTAYKKVVATLGETTSTGGTKLSSWPEENAAPDGAVEGDIFYVETLDLEPAEATEATPYEFNKYDKVTPGKEILVTLFPNRNLKADYPGALITINGKEYTLGYAENPFKLVMDRDYRISINWVWGEVVETFRIICNR